jgi:porin
MIKLAISLLFLVTTSFAFSEEKNEIVSYGLGLMTDMVTNVVGAGKRKATYLTNLDFTADVDLEKLMGHKDAQFSIYFLGNWGGDPTEFVGDSFATSNIESPDAFKVYEIYYTKSFFESFTISLGLKDLNADFNAVDSAGAFINSAFGISPAISQTGTYGPSIFPATSSAIVLSYQSEAKWFAKLGAFNAKASNPENPKLLDFGTDLNDGYLTIAEAGFYDEESATKYAIGALQYSKELPTTADPDLLEVNQGAYVMIDQPIIGDLNAFAKYAMMSETINTFSSEYDVGLSYSGIIKLFKSDTLFVGYARANFAEDYIDANASAEYESVTEVGYTMGFADGLSVTPDVQMIQNAGGVKDADPVTVATLRVELEF